LIGSTRQVRVFACSHPVDMRKGYDGLSAIVTNELGRDVLSGDLCLFVNRTRKRNRSRIGVLDDAVEVGA
jgi:transposase